MAGTLTIRLNANDREVLEEAARRRGIGVSALMRELAEAEAHRMRRDAIRAEGDRVVAYLVDHPEAQSELDEIGAPSAELP